MKMLEALVPSDAIQLSCLLKSIELLNIEESGITKGITGRSRRE